MAVDPSEPVAEERLWVEVVFVYSLKLNITIQMQCSVTYGVDTLDNAFLRTTLH